MSSSLPHLQFTQVCVGVPCIFMLKTVDWPTKTSRARSCTYLVECAGTPGPKAALQSERECLCAHCWQLSLTTLARQPPRFHDGKTATAATCPLLRNAMNTLGGGDPPHRRPSWHACSPGSRCYRIPVQYLIHWARGPPAGAIPEAWPRGPAVSSTCSTSIERPWDDAREAI